MKLLNVLLFIVLSFPAIAEENALERALYNHWEYCWGAIAGEYELKGLDLRLDAFVLEKSEVELREKFFSVPQDAIKEFVIGADGQAMHVIYREELICAGETMNMYCGSGGCSRDFVINHDIYEIFGGKPSLVTLTALQSSSLDGLVQIAIQGLIQLLAFRPLSGMNLHKNLIPLVAIKNL